MIVIVIVAALAIWVVLSGICANVAEMKGYSRGTWFLLCFFLPPFAHILVAALPDLEMRAKVDRTNELLEELIKTEQTTKTTVREVTPKVVDTIILPEI